jgi:glycosyltransferase involved in cell wall biosynthesis
MRVLYVSKASRVASHREKLRVLAASVEVTLVVPERWGRTGWDPAAFDEALEIRRLPTLFHGHNHLHLYRRLTPVLATTAFDLVHVDEEPYSLVTAQVSRLARRRGLPALFFAWQNLDKRLPPPFGAIRRRVLGSVAGGIAGTAEAASVLRRAGFEGPLLVSPQMGVETARFRPDADAHVERRRELGLRADTPLLGFVGRLVREKGVDLVVRALPTLPGCHLLLVGDGPEREPLRRLAAGLGVGDRVHDVGAVASLDVPRWTGALDVLVLPSRTTDTWKEQFGRAAVEAMACGVPVVASDSGALPEVLGAAGQVVPEGSVAALGDAIAALLREPDERRRLARLGRARVEEHFTNRRVVDDQVHFYGQVLTAARGRGR